MDIMLSPDSKKRRRPETHTNNNSFYEYSTDNDDDDTQPTRKQRRVDDHPQAESSGIQLSKQGDHPTTSDSDSEQDMDISIDNTHHGRTTDLNSIATDANEVNTRGNGTSMQRNLRIQPAPLHKPRSVDSFKGAYVAHEYPINERIDADFIIPRYAQSLFKDMRKCFELHGTRTSHFKVIFEASFELEKRVPGSEETEKSAFSITTPIHIVSKKTIKNFLKFAHGYIVKRVPEEVNRVEGSGATMGKVLYIRLNYFKQALGGYVDKSKNKICGYVEYPKGLAGKDETFNPDGKGNMCLIQCLCAYFMRKKFPRRDWCTIKRSIEGKKRKYWEHVNYPWNYNGGTWDSLNVLERLNNICINIYDIQKLEDGYDLAMARKGSTEHTEVVSLLLLADQHVLLIKNFHKFVELFSHSETYRFFCRTCLTGFTKKEEQTMHSLKCKSKTKLEFRKPGEKLIFRSMGKTHPVSHICFFDFEAMLLKTNNDHLDSIESVHKAISFGYIIINRKGEVVGEMIYTGLDAVNVFIQELQKNWEQIKETQPQYECHITHSQLEDFKNRKHCELCEVAFKEDDKYLRKVKHHIHTEKNNNYAGAYCNRCNLACADRYNSLTVYAHNASYDLGLILRELEVQKKMKINILPKQGLKYHSVRINQLNFQDSMAVINGGLESIGKAFLESGTEPKYTYHMLKGLTDQAKKDIVNGKQHFPYEYMDNISKLDDASLPPMRSFDSALNNKKITESEYQHAQKMWDDAGCLTLKDYMETYLKIDVGLLADSFMQWRKTLYDEHKLDVAHYVSLPGFAYDAALKKTKVELDYPYDSKLYKLIESNIRGGFTSVVKQKSQAFNKDTTKDMKGKESSYLLYLDFNSLYATVMSEKLPVGDIRELSEEEKDKLIEVGLENIDTNGDIGYWVLFDSEPLDPDVARYTDDLPLGFTHMNIREEMLSPYTKEIARKEGRKFLKKNVKLVGTHYPKKDYLVSLPLLQIFLKLKMKIKKVHTIYQFKQQSFLEPFIDINIEARKNASSKAAKNAFKCCSNSTYGRFLMNPGKFNKVTYVCHNRNIYLKHARNPRFKRAIALRPNRLLCVCERHTVKIDQPNHIGFAILQASKCRLFSFWYFTLKEYYGEKVELIYTDTDSYIFRLKTEDILQEFKKAPLRDHMDFSNFPANHELYDNSKCSQRGLLKSETADMFISECIALKPKMYSIVIEQEDSIQRAKGVPRHIQSQLLHEEYAKTLESYESFTFTARNIRNVNGQMSTTKMTKSALSAFDDKRYHVNAYKSYAFGHPDIPSEYTHQEDELVVTDDEHIEMEINEEEDDKFEWEDTEDEDPEDIISSEDEDDISNREPNNPTQYISAIEKDELEAIEHFLWLNREQGFIECE